MTLPTPDEALPDHESRILWVSSVQGGASTSNRGWNTAITDLMKRSRLRQESRPTSPLRLNVVFHVPGPIARPDYEGVRTGSFSRKRLLLTVQVALPEQAPNDAYAFLLKMLGEALTAAEEWAIRKGLSVELIHLREIERQLALEHGANS